MFADAATDNDTQVGPNAPNVSITSTAGATTSQPAAYTNIELVNLRPDNATQVVNILGDNNGLNANQQDEYLILGADIDSSIVDSGNGFGSDADGANEFFLLINGSNPIGVYNVRFLNVTGAGGDDDITLDPYADNALPGSPVGWGIDVRVDGGSTVETNGDDIFYGNVERDTTLNPGIVFIDDSPNGSRSGVSESVNLAPTGTTGGGQIRSTNATDGSNIVTVDFTNVEDTSFFFNNGAAGDTDTLTIHGTAAANTVTTNFTNAGDDATGPWVDIDLTAGATQLVQVERFTRATPNAGAVPTLSALDQVTINLGSGDDVLNFTGRSNAASTLAPTTVNVDGGNPGASDSINLTGTAGLSDTYVVTPGASSDSGTIAVTLNASPTSTINFTTTEAIAIDGGGGIGSDTLTLNGTGANNAFVLSGTGSLAGSPN